ncbi:MAG: hypothetical protein VB106_03065 [Clostridiaceae bacterium]|nr:hypothetical protein [Clostridiaceae bacterium]
MMKRITPFISSGRGPAILRNCIVLALLFMFILKEFSANVIRNSGEIVEIVAGLFIILFSMYDTFIRKEKNTVWGIPTWVYGGAIFILGAVFYLYNNSLI